LAAKQGATERHERRTQGGEGGFRKGMPPGRQETVKAGINVLSCADPLSGRRNTTARKRWRRGMSVVVFILLTLAIFSLLGVIQKLVEHL
jgi:hypothetical protein